MLTVALGCFAFLAQSRAVSPPADGCYPGFTTAEGCNALNLLTTGAGNTALGWSSLSFDTTGNYNTGVGAGALALNNGDSNTAAGAVALLLNTSGTANTAVGANAMVYNDTGTRNTAVGASALFNNTDGPFNCAFGDSALLSNVTGNNNTAVGLAALQNSNGVGNTALGAGAGNSATTGNGNVYIGAFVEGIAGESGHTYIRNINTTSVSGGGTDTVTVNLANGLLGHLSSSRRHKEDIKPMDNASQTLYRLTPVTFRYKKEIDQNQVLDYGLIAEDVAKIDPNLANLNRDGHIESVRYNAINAMLLNEFLKEHKKVQQLETTMAQKQEAFESQLMDQKKQIDSLTADLQRVSARIETSRPAPLTVANP